MPQPAKLKYHQVTLSFLNHKAAFASSAVKKIEAGEKKIGLQLPASVREWYSLAGWEEAVSKLRKQVLTKDAARFPIGLADVPNLLKNLQELQNNMDAFRRGGHTPSFTVGAEPGNPYRWYVALDGSDDPPVFEIDRDQIKVAEHFSSFIFGLVWEPFQVHDTIRARDTNRCWLVAEKHPCGYAHLDFLKEHYSEGLVHQSRYEEGTRYAFYNADGTITIQCPGDAVTKEVPAHWSFTADSVPSLVKLITPVWQFGGLNRALSSALSEKFAGKQIKSKEGEQALKELRGKPKGR
jgi:hypothetical protein